MINTKNRTNTITLSVKGKLDLFVNYRFLDN